MKSPRSPGVDLIRIGRITSYEVLESDLERIESGPPESVYLSFGFSLLSIAATLFATLASTTINPARVYYTFVIIASVSAVGSLVFFSLWWPQRDYYKRIVSGIRKKLDLPLGIPEAPGPTEQ